MRQDVNERFKTIRRYLAGELCWADASFEEIALGYEAQAADEDAEMLGGELCLASH